MVTHSAADGERARRAIRGAAEQVGESRVERELRELGALHQAGTLTGEEFALAKRALIAAATSAQGPTQAAGPDLTESASAATELSAPRESAWRPQPAAVPCTARARVW